MRLRMWRFDLPLRHTFTISRGSIDVQPTLIVGVEDRGAWGFGEATSNSYYGVEIADMAHALDQLRPRLATFDFQEPEPLWEFAQSCLKTNPFAHCALDQAAYDLWGKLRGQPVHRLLGLQLDQIPKSNYTIGIDDPEAMAEKLREFPDWPIYKIKLGADLDADLKIINRLRQETNAVFRVDANCAWTAEQTIHMSRALAPLHVEFIEQPLPAELIDEMPEVKAQSALPLIADENCQAPDDVPRCEAGFHGINIKLVKCGGITPALRMIRQARSLNLQVMVGCMTESTVGISAIAQLLPLLDYVDMDGAVLLAEDVAAGARVVQGVCQFPSGNGAGVEMLKSGVELYPC